MKHYININSGVVFGFELDGSQDEFITSDMVKMSDSDFKSYKLRPSKYHSFNTRVMLWEITNEDQEKLDIERKQSDRNKAIEEVARMRMRADRLLLPLQYRVDLGVAVKPHIDEIVKIKEHIIELDEWKYPNRIPRM